MCFQKGFIGSGAESVPGASQCLFDEEPSLASYLVKRPEGTPPVGFMSSAGMRPVITKTGMRPFDTVKLAPDC